MLAVIVLVAVGGALATQGIAGLVRAQRQAADLVNRYAVLNDVVGCLRADVRAADAAELATAEGAGEGHVLRLRGASGVVEYRLGTDRVERTGPPGDDVRDKSWHMQHALDANERGHTEWDVRVPRTGPGAGRLVELTVLWQRRARDDAQPPRRFDVVLRCAGVRRDETQ